jgi:hypothetical protein
MVHNYYKNGNGRPAAATAVVPDADRSPNLAH